MAHALGIGVYRSDGLLQHPDEPSLWQEIGYSVIHGRLQAGRRVTLERSKDSAPEYFERLLSPGDAVLTKWFPDEQAQDAWVAEEIAKNLDSDELEPDDILIVLPDTYRARSRAPRLMRELQRRSIASHLVGVTTSLDAVFRVDSVAIAHIYRAKGNEAPMVYAVDSQYAAQDFNAVTRRNTLFTAITRSRAWVRIVGWGLGMTAIGTEARTVADKQFRLEFTVPTAEKLRTLRHIYRDRSAEDEESVRKATEGLAAFLEAIDRGEMDLNDLPPALRTRLITLRDEPGDDY
jgi:superfamily I DNA and RNA helicase